MTETPFLPTLNAALNGTSFILLIAGYVFVRLRRLTAHKICMLAATGVSILFLICYLYYHYHHGSTRFQGQGPVRVVYFTILISHTLLATAIVPMILITLFHAARRNFDKHARMARLTWPLWMYVSLTGVAVYSMLYRVGF